MIAQLLAVARASKERSHIKAVLSDKIMYAPVNFLAQFATSRSRAVTAGAIKAPQHGGGHVTGVVGVV